MRPWDFQKMMIYCLPMLEQFLYQRTVTLIKRLCLEFLNQARAGRKSARAWFLIITFIPPKYACVCVCVCVYVYAPEGINKQWRDFDFK